MLAELTFDTDRMAAAADDPAAAATDLAEFLVRRRDALPGRPRRRRRPRPAVDRRRRGRWPTLVAAEPRLGPEAAALLEPGVAVTMRTTRGAGGPAALPLQREAYAARLAEDHARR